ncbi:NUDIX domain-containing protein [Roseibium marinum]|uniref:ADP-ribose pyrophosphatase YjhB (NUDIX family) n=1 Tax=Roseibium marinum TaxID=281252 RepID=A0A2S3UQ75_9HYPH|nr:NUDIX domain-containing protein [Roseibium marinum]POF29836.1 ADP-ribose pyrophosphatase YjhB (NUDIX family) [Roseibium marinum]
MRILSYLPNRWTTRLVQGINLVRNPVTLGVRVIVEDEGNRILLIRHSYVTGWYLPGGGVDRGETMEEAACREVQEEAGIAPAGRPVLLNIYLNEEATGRDHVGLFHLQDWIQHTGFLQPNAEVLEAAFFAPEQLPEDVSGATARRLAEFRAGEFLSSRW